MAQSSLIPCGGIGGTTACHLQQEISARITECFTWEGTFKDHLISPPAMDRTPSTRPGCAKSQPGLENFQGCGICNFFGQPVPVLSEHPPHRLLPYIQSQPALFN